MWLAKSHKANLQKSRECRCLEELTSPTQGSLHQGLYACCSTTTLNTERSWWGALWSRFKLMCKCKICAWKTQLLNQIITVNKDTHSKENLKETVVKFSYFSHPPLTSCHIFEKSLTPALPVHFPWVRTQNQAVYGINGPSMAGHWEWIATAWTLTAWYIMAVERVQYGLSIQCCTSILEEEELLGKSCLLWKCWCVAGFVCKSTCRWPQHLFPHSWCNTRCKGNQPAILRV